MLAFLRAAGMDWKESGSKGILGIKGSTCTQKGLADVMRQNEAMNKHVSPTTSESVVVLFSAVQAS